MPSIVEQIIEVRYLIVSVKLITIQHDASAFSIPIIDFSKYLHGSAVDKAACAHEIIEGFTSSGFIYLSNYGIPASELAEVYRHSADFFKLGEHTKEALPWQGAASNRGYSAMGREKVSEFMDADSIGQERQSLPDLKESFEIGREPCDEFPNKWPAELPDFPAKMMHFFDTCHEVHREVMRAIAIGLKLDEHWFDPFTQVADNTLRLLHYPSIHPAIFDKIGQVRAGSHSDYGSITLLFQDESGGLQVQRPDGSFVDAKPVPDTIIVNAGDLLSRWSNDLIKSTHHRVIQPPMPPAANGNYPARYSIAVGCFHFVCVFTNVYKVLLQP